MLCLTVSSAVWLAAAAASGQGPRTVWDAVYTDGQAARGAALYGERCAACHGDTLTGVEAAPALTGAVFSATWEGVTLGDLAERIRTSMPLDAPGSLSRRQTSDLLAHMLRVGGFPSGAVELAADAAVLGQIVVRASKP
jgi:quinoprotein glucose dehydrogenase